MKYISLFIVAGFFILATFLLVSPYFAYLNQEIRVIFAVFLYLYGSFRLVRVFIKRPRHDDEREG